MYHVIVEIFFVYYVLWRQRMHTFTSGDVRCERVLWKTLQQCRFSFMYHVIVEIFFVYYVLWRQRMVLSGRCEY